MDDWSSSFQNFSNGMDVARRIQARDRLVKLGLAEPTVTARDALTNVVKAPFQLMGAGARSLKGMASPMMDAFKQGYGKPKQEQSWNAPMLSAVPPKKPSLFSYNF